MVDDFRAWFIAGPSAGNYGHADAGNTYASQSAGCGIVVRGMYRGCLEQINAQALQRLRASLPAYRSHCELQLDVPLFVIHPA